MIDMSYANGTIDEALKFMSDKYPFYMVKNMHQLFCIEFHDDVRTIYLNFFEYVFVVNSLISQEIYVWRNGRGLKYGISYHAGKSSIHFHV